MSQISMQRIIDGSLTSADSATLTIVNDDGTTVVVPTVVAPTSEGVYNYTTSYLPPGRYTAIWTFVEAGWTDDTIWRPFMVDQIQVASEGINLASLERRVARACGQYRKLKAGAGSSQSSIQSDRLVTSQNLGVFETEFVLRRGLYWFGAVVEDFDDDDRVRGLVTYSGTAGSITVDREYTNAPIENELLELMYLDPEEELRFSVVEGLERCFFWDTNEISYTGMGADINVTASLPWLTNPNWIKRMEYSMSASRMPPNRVQWFAPYRSGRAIYLRSAGVAPGTISITALRPHKSFVNGEMSYSGPNDDLDTLHVDTDYAVAAGVLRIWENHPERVAPLAMQGMRPTREDWANQFTTKSLAIMEQEPEYLRHRWGHPLDITQVGNLAELV